MKKSTIQFTIELDDKNIPEKITWDATDKPDASPSETKAISLSIWDSSQQDTLRFDLWTKETPADVLKMMYIDSIAAMSQNIIKATGDEAMAREMSDLCSRLVKFVGKS